MRRNTCSVAHGTRSDMTPPLMPDILALIKAGHDAYTFIHEAKIRAMRGAVAAREIEDLYEFIRWRYADLPVLAGPDGPFPVAVLELSPAVMRDPELITGSRLEPKAPLLVKSQVIEEIMKRGSQIWNGDTFSLSAVNLDGHGLVRTL